VHHHFESRRRKARGKKRVSLTAVFLRVSSRFVDDDDAFSASAHWSVLVPMSKSRESFNPVSEFVLTVDHYDALYVQFLRSLCVALMAGLPLLHSTYY